MVQRGSTRCGSLCACLLSHRWPPPLHRLHAGRAHGTEHRLLRLAQEHRRGGDALAGVVRFVAVARECFEGIRTNEATHDKEDGATMDGRMASAGATTD